MKKGGVVIILLIVLGLIILLGCAFGSYFVYNNYIREEVAEKVSETIVEEAIESGTGDDVDVDFNNEGEGSMHVEDEDTSVDFSTDKQWPEDLPSYVPEFTQGEQVSSSKVSESGSGTGWSMIFENVETGAFDNYENELKDNGWSINASADTMDTSMFAGVRGGGNDTITVTYNSEEKTFTITVSITE